jgi:hypothetical protein
VGARSRLARRLLEVRITTPARRGRAKNGRCADMTTGKGPNVMKQTKRSDQDSANSASYTKTIVIQASPRKLYEAVTTVSGLKGWWSNNTVAKDGNITVRFDGIFQTLRLLDPTPHKKVVWEWIAQYFPLKGDDPNRRVGRNQGVV